MMLTNRRGFTLVELIVVMAMFMIVLIITSQSFNTVITHAGQQMKSAETQTEGIIGLELLRSDIAVAGAGLPWGGYNNDSQTSVPPNYQEVSNAPNFPVNGVDSASFNDETNKPPRAIWTANNTGFNGSDYLVIKSAAVGMSATGRKFGEIDNLGNINNDAAGFVNGERLILLRGVFSSTGDMQDRQLVMDSNNKFFTTFPSFAGFIPNGDLESYAVIGIDPDTDLRMPFNRADYYIRRPTNVPDSCAPGTGILYKNPVNQANGAVPLINEKPLLDCVADLQVIYSLNSGLHVDDPNNIPNTGDLAKGIRDNVTELRVYILAQEGKKDPSYTFPTNPNGQIVVGEFNAGRTFDFAANGITDWQNYHWKIYTIVVALKNLQ